MRHSTLAFWLTVALTASVIACDRTPSGSDAGHDAGSDAGRDADSDAGHDADRDADSDAGPGDADVAGRDADENDARLEPRTFRLWAPGVDGVEVLVESDGYVPHPLSDAGDGHWVAADVLAAEGDRYHYTLERGGERFARVDPSALSQAPGWSESILHRRAFEWPASEAEFRRPSLRDAVIYELHVGSFTTDAVGHGTFVSAQSRLDHLEALGVNVIELMPIVEFAGESGWGYGPAFLMGVERAYGEPADLQRFVEAAHARGIAVILDVVVNHLSRDTPLCDFLALRDGACGEPWFHEDARGMTDWGPRPAFDVPAVREHILGAAATWLETFHVDGFRWDSTSNIRYTDHGEGEPLPGGQELLRAATGLVDGAGEDAIDIAEDFHLGDELTRPVGEGGYGFDAQWGGGLHWNIRPAVVEGRVDLGGLAGALATRYNGDPFQRVEWTESHDSTGYYNGNVRLPEEIAPSDPTGWLARKRSTLAAGILLTMPAVPMLLQGQEMLQTGTFHDTTPLDWSNLETHAGIVELYRDLIALRRNLRGTTAGLRGPNVAVTHRNDGARVIIYHRWDRGGAGDDVMVVANLGGTAFPEYILGFPRPGTWRVRFDSDSSRYAPDFTDVSVASATTVPEARDGFAQSAAIAVGPYSVVVLSQGS